MKDSKFTQTMSDLGYTFEEQEHQDNKKLYFRKRTQFSDLVLIFDLGMKSINPILIPISYILYEHDLDIMLNEFWQLRKEAEYLARLSNYKVLN